MKRIFVAGIATEVNTFSPIFIDRDAFEKALLALPYQHPDTPTLCTSPIIHARALARQGEIELVEGTICWADPGGMINKTTYEDLREEILGQLREALRERKLDALIFCLHGAMVAQGYNDPEGDLIERARAIVGEQTIISVGLDPHSHLTHRRAKYSDIMIAFKEFPHIDFSERGRELVHLTILATREVIRPIISVFDCKMIDIFLTTHPKMRQFVDRLQALERDPSNSIISVSLIHGFMAGDVPEMGTKIMVISDNDKAYGDALARKLGLEVFALRGQCSPEQADENETLEQALELKKTSDKPIVIADMWDNPGGGVAGDATSILKEVIRRKITNVAFATIWDPMATRLCSIAGEGARISLRFGGKSAPNCGDVVDAQVLVKKIVPKATQTFCDSVVSIGDSVLIEFEGIEVILNSTRAQVFERSVFTAFGIEPRAKDMLVVKSTNHFHRDFSQISDHILYCDAGAPYPKDPRKTSYIYAPKDIWPIVDNPHI